MKRLAIALVVSLSVLTSLAASAAAPKRVVVRTWDGSAKWLIDKMLAEKALPHLAEMIRDGAAAEYSTSNFPNCTTPPGHAALFTGCYGVDNGVVGYHQPKIPIDRYDLTEHWSGFDARNLRAEPMWVTLARAGGKSMLMHSPFATPMEPYGAWKRFGIDAAEHLTAFTGYSGAQLARDHVYTSAAALRRPGAWTNLPEKVTPTKELSFTIGGTPFYAVFYDDPADPVAGLDTGAAGADRDFAKAVKFKPAKPGSPDAFAVVEFPGKPGVGFALRLIELDPEGKTFRMFRTACYEPAGNLPPAKAAELLKEAGLFTGNGAGIPARRGELGTPLTDGGDGSAERIYLESVALCIRHQTSATLWALKNAPTGLVLGYIPIPDEAGHNWAGFIEPGGPAFDAALAPKLEPVMRAVLVEADNFLGAVRKAAGPDTVVVLSSDHGMRGYTHVVKPNVALKAAGLLAATGNKIDLSKTKAIFHPAGHGYVTVNTIDRKGGIVKPTDKDAVIAEAKAALLAAKDAAGKPVFEHVWDADPPGGRLGLGLPATGDLFLVARSGLKMLASPADELVGPVDAGSGQHDALPTDAPLRTLMVFAGPGTAKGKAVGPVRHIDLAPTVLKLLGSPPGPKMTGRVLTEVME